MNRRKWFLLKTFNLKKLKSHKLLYTIKGTDGKKIDRAYYDDFEKCFYWNDGEDALYIFGSDEPVMAEKILF